jgi:hypothetical protein
VNFALTEFSEGRTNAAREIEMAPNVQGTRLSVAYRKMHPGSPNTGVLVVDCQHLGE